MTTVNVRYMVHDTKAAIAFYTTVLGFRLISDSSPAFADGKIYIRGAKYLWCIGKK